MQKKSIVLIDPPGWQGAIRGDDAIPNNGLAYIAAVLKQDRWDVLIFDMNNEAWDITGLCEKIRGISPDFVGISCKTATIHSAEKILRTIKDADRRIRVILGGPHITLNSNALENLPADLLFEGDAETDLPVLLDSILDNTECGDKLLYGEFHREKNKPSVYRRVKLQPIPENIFPDYSLFPENVKQYIRTNYPIFSSRGCPYHCIYCSVPLISGAVWRARSVDSILNELKHAAETWHISKFNILDDSWNVNMDRCKEMCREIREKLPGIQCAFPNGIRADRVDDELAELMKSCNCRQVAVGFENTDPEVFDNIHKGTTIDRIVEGIRILKRNGLKVSAYFIVGLPLDTFEKEKKNIRYIRSLGITPFFNLLIPYPFTKVHEYVTVHGTWMGNPEESLHYCNYLETIPIIFDYPYFPADKIRHSYIAAIISSGMYERLSAKPKFSLGYYFESAGMILKYAPEYLPAFLMAKFLNIFVQIHRKIKGVNS